jgi:hypothetical protein
MRFFALFIFVTAPCTINSFTGIYFPNHNTHNALNICQKYVRAARSDGSNSFVPLMCLDSPDPAKRQAYQDVALRGLVDVGQRVPQEWSEGTEFEFSEMSCFQANEIVVLKRPDGALRFGRIELTSSAALINDDTVELGRGGNSARSIHVVEIERGLLGSRQYRSSVHTLHLLHFRRPSSLFTIVEAEIVVAFLPR